MCWQCDLLADASVLPEADLPDMAPVPLPTAAELVIAAETSAIVPRLQKFVASLGAGREPAPDDPEARFVERWATAGGLVRLVKGRLVPVKKRAKLLNQPLELWQRAFETFPSAAELLTDYGNWSRMFDTVSLTLYSAAGTPIPMLLLDGIVRAELATAYPFFGGLAEYVLGPDDLAAVLAMLEEQLGAVEITETTDPAELAKISELAETDSPDGRLVRLTPIGLWALNASLREAGLAAPVAGDLAPEEIGTIYTVLGMSSPQVVEAELALWVKRRGPAVAAEEAAEFLRRAASPSERFFSLLALAQAGDHGVAAGGRARSDGGVAGAVTTAWLVEQGAISAESVTEAEGKLGMTDYFAAMHEQGMFLDALLETAAENQAALIGILVETEHPHRLDLLDALAAEHPDAKIAKKARKARLKVRSAGIQS